MRRLFLIAFFVQPFTMVPAQSLSFALEGGYAFTQYGDAHQSLDGLLVNGVYEYQMPGSKVSHAVSLGYANLRATVDHLNSPPSYRPSSELKSWVVPLFYMPKLSFGSERVQAFIKLNVGFALTGLSMPGNGPFNSGSIDYQTHGFAVGAGVGLNFNITKLVFVRSGYDVLFLPNSHYENGLFQTFAVGAGMRF